MAVRVHERPRAGTSTPPREEVSLQAIETVQLGHCHARHGEYTHGCRPKGANVTQDTAGFCLAVAGTACWAVCFWWMHRISQRQNAMLQELQHQARSIEAVSKEEHEILKELHPTVQKIEESVDQVKESTQS